MSLFGRKERNGWRDIKLIHRLIMAHKKKGFLTYSAEWVKHLRKDMKRIFWSGERNAKKKLMKKEKEELNELKKLKWQLDEVLKTLIAISMPPKEQHNLYGVGIASDDMIEDLKTYFTLKKARYLKLRLLDEYEVNEINKIVLRLDFMVDSMREDEWYDINSNYQWKELRDLSKQVLNKIGRDNLKLIVEHENEYDKNGNISIQRTKTQLANNAI